MFNTDQGSQFTNQEFTQVLQDRGVRTSMDGIGRYADNILVERLARTAKNEEVSLEACTDAGEVRREVGAYFRFYNDRRPHRAPACQTMAEVFHRAKNATEEEPKAKEDSPERVLVSLAGTAGLSLNSIKILSN